MSIYLKKTISFFILFIAVITIFIETTEFIVQKNAEFRLDSNTKYIVLGHSHPECAFNDSLITGLKNFSQSGETYYYTYFKTKKVLNQNPNIEVVFIEFTNNQIREYMDNRIWGEEYINYRYPVYSPFIESLDKFVLIRNNLSGFINVSALTLKENYKRITDREFDYIKTMGGYLYLERNFTDSLVDTMQNSVTPLEYTKISNRNIEYLSKTVEWTLNQGKKVFLIRSPLHPKYEGYSNENQFQEIRNKEFPSVEFIDFSKFPLDNSEFGDLQHLNYKGAKIFSDYFAEKLRNGLLDDINKQELIDQDIETIKLLNSYK